MIKTYTPNYVCFVLHKDIQYIFKFVCMLSFIGLDDSVYKLEGKNLNKKKNIELHQYLYIIQHKQYI
jgi:hypothetical protein